MRSIPPKTSTGLKKIKCPRLSNGLNLSLLGEDTLIRREELGREVSKVKESSTRGPWNISEHIYKKVERKSRKVVYHHKSIECIADIIENYNDRGDLGAILEFHGISFLNDDFIRSKKNYGENTCVYYTLISYRGKNVFLILSTIEDILEYEIVPKKKGLDKIFSDKVCIPELIKIYNPRSMEVTQKNMFVLVNYKKMLQTDE